MLTEGVSQDSLRPRVVSALGHHGFEKGHIPCKIGETYSLYQYKDSQAKTVDVKHVNVFK